MPMIIMPQSLFLLWLVVPECTSVSKRTHIELGSTKHGDMTEVEIFPCNIGIFIIFSFTFSYVEVGRIITEFVSLSTHCADARPSLVCD